MFLDRFKSDNWKIEFAVIWKTGAVVVDEKYALKSKVHNVYFLANVRKDLEYNWYNRAKDIDIIEKSYLVLDIDLRKQFKDKYGYDITDEEIIETWKQIADYIEEEHQYLWDYDFIVFSWNGLHIYYLWEPRYISPDDYAYAMERIMRQWDSLWGDEIFNTDKACKNIARIIRLPWSINQKTWKECFVIKERQWQGLLFNIIESLWAKEKLDVMIKREEEVSKQIEEYERMEKMNRLIKWSSYDEDKWKIKKVFEKINNIPAYIIAEKFVPEFKFSKNEKNFHNLKWGFTWYYYVKELNSICNWGSQYFSRGDVNSCWSSSVLIKNEINWNWWDVIKWVKDNFNIKI